MVAPTGNHLPLTWQPEMTSQLAAASSYRHIVHTVCTLRYLLIVMRFGARSPFLIWTSLQNTLGEQRWLYTENYWENLRN